MPQALETLAPPAMRYRPLRELIIAHNGALLAAGEARYGTLREYVEQFAAPLSSLRSIGFFSWYDPLNPESTIVLQCEAVPWCGRCHTSLDLCDCPFSGGV